MTDLPDNSRWTPERLTTLKAKALLLGIKRLTFAWGDHRPEQRIYEWVLTDGRLFDHSAGGRIWRGVTMEELSRCLGNYLQPLQVATSWSSVTPAHARLLDDSYGKSV